MKEDDTISHNMYRMRARGDAVEQKGDKANTATSENVNNIRPKGDDLSDEGATGERKPRKCLVIKKKKVGNEMEKVEMRFVAYNKVEKGVRTTNLEIINDASNYLYQRAGEVEYLETESENSKTFTKTDEIGKLRECDARKLRLCIPILYKIRARFEESAKNEKHSLHKRKQSVTMKAMCDEIIEEASYTMENQHPISNDLMKKIQNINNLSRQILNKESKADSLSNDYQELALSKSNTVNGN